MKSEEGREARTLLRPAKRDYEGQAASATVFETGVRRLASASGLARLAEGGGCGANFSEQNFRIFAI